MIVSCPNCSTRYLVADAAIGQAGRRVRCARCRHTWFQEPGEMQPDLPRAAPSVEPQPLPPGSNLPVIHRPRRRGHALGWAVLVLFVVAVVGGVLLLRNEVVAAWPASARLYQALGVPVAQPGEGLALRNVTSARQLRDGASVLVVTGEVANLSGRARDIPPIRVAVRGPGDAELFHWVFSGDRGRLGPGEVAPFATELDKPVEGATGVALSFAGPGRDGR